MKMKKKQITEETLNYKEWVAEARKQTMETAIQ